MAQADKRTGFSLKDELFNRQTVKHLADQFQASDATFDGTGFLRTAVKPFKQLELKARIAHIAQTLETHLSSDFTVAARQIVDALPPPLDPSNTDDDFGDFIMAPLGEFVVRNGLARQHLRTSLKTLKAITQRFSMEDAIRAFINQHTAPTLAELKKWSTSRNYHVRRLVSEGTRPILPWSTRLSIAPETALPLLETLHADPTRYVTRSVANHLNDISKTNASVVVQTLTRWKRLEDQDPQELQWMSRHALRTLVKRGHVGALKFLGFRPNPKIEITDFKLTTTDVQPGDAIEFSFTVKADRAESLIVDYVIDFVKANGQLSPKVHKIKQMDIPKGATRAIQKRHVLRANATTYTLYPGTHQVTLQINGRSFGTKSFELRTP